MCKWLRVEFRLWSQDFLSSKLDFCFLGCPSICMIKTDTKGHCDKTKIEG